MTADSSLKAEIPDSMAGLRLDQVLAELFPDFSRSRLQQWVRAGQVTVDDQVLPSKQRMLGGEWIHLLADAAPVVHMQPQAIDLDCIYSDDALLVINKPAGLVVHPAAGHADGTLQNALLHFDPQLATIPRCGIVHRLDKDTTGLMVVARTLPAHHSLVEQLQARSVSREYLALVQGCVTGGGTIDEPLGRHPTDRKRFAVRPDGREAITHYRLEERFSGHTLLRVKLETGRTHQIRVHLSHRHYPLVGDPVYGGRARIPAGIDAELLLMLRQFHRQALHAQRLGLEHPVTGELMTWEQALPEDYAQLLDALRVRES